MAVGDVLAGCDRPFVVTTGHPLTPGRSATAEPTVRLLVTDVLGDREFTAIEVKAGQAVCLHKAHLTEQETYAAVQSLPEPYRLGGLG